MPRPVTTWRQLGDVVGTVLETIAPAPKQTAQAIKPGEAATVR